MVRAVAGVAAALLVAVAVSFLVAGGDTRRGCIAATVPYSIGGEVVDACGQSARTICQAVGTPVGFTGAAARVVGAECRKAGLSIGSGSH